MSTTDIPPTPERPSRAAAPKPLWRRLIGFNLLTAVILGVAGYYIGWWLGHQIKSPVFEYESATSENDVALLLAYAGGVVGFLIGLGFVNYPVGRLLGRPASLREREERGDRALLRPLHRSQGRRASSTWSRSLFFFFVAGLNAMFIRGELTHDNATFIRAGNIPHDSSACTAR